MTPRRPAIQLHIKGLEFRKKRACHSSNTLATPRGRKQGVRQTRRQRRIRAGKTSIQAGRGAFGGCWDDAGERLMQVASLQSASHGTPPNASGLHQFKNPHRPPQKKRKPSTATAEADDVRCVASSSSPFCIITSFSFMLAAFSSLLAGRLDKCVYDISRLL